MGARRRARPGRIDCVYVRGDTAEKLFDSARPMPGPAGRELLVPKPEHLIAMKVLAMKNDPDRTLQDMATTRCAPSSPATACTRGSMSSADALDRLAEDLPTTPEDVEALRRLRMRRIEGALRHPNLLAPPAFLPPPRRTFEGCPEFVL